MSVALKQPKAEITNNDLKLDVSDLTLNKQTRKKVDVYINDCLEFESNWDDLLESRRELLASAMDMKLGDLIEEADKLQLMRSSLQGILSDLLKRRLEILPLLDEPYRNLVADCKASIEDAFKAVAKRFESQGMGIECENGYRVNESAAKIQYRHRCSREPEVLKANGQWNELQGRYNGYVTQRTINPKYSEPRSHELTRWPSVPDGRQKRIAEILSLL